MKNFMKIAMIFVLVAVLLIATVSCENKTPNPEKETITTQAPTQEKVTNETPTQEATESVTDAPSTPTDTAEPTVGMQPGQDADGDKYGDWVAKP